MLPSSRSAVFARAVLLPLLLALAVVLGLGSYFETSDDGSLAWLFAGVLALKPVASVPLYLHGYGHLLAAAYAIAPAGPWLGLLLAGLLAAASVLWFAVLERLLGPWLRPGLLVLALALFFGMAWLEHWLWFSHARVALLLAAGGVLFAAQRPARRGPLVLGLAALLAAWLVRPGLAGLGFVAVLPAAWQLAGSWRRAAPLLLSAGVLLALAFGIKSLRQTPTEARVQARDVRLAQILDYEQLRPIPRTTADSLGTEAVSAWLLGDSTMVDQALHGPVYRFEAAYFVGRVMPAKLALRAGLLLRDYFPLLLALLATAGAISRSRPNRLRGFWLVQAGFALGLAALAGILKLPPRLALPLLDCWLLTNLAFWLPTPPFNAPVQGSEGDIAASEPNNSRQAPRSIGERPGPFQIGARRRLATLAVLAVAGLYAAKTWHRHQVLQREQQRHEEALAAISRETGRLRVLAGANDFLKSLSPFRAYRLGRQPVLLLTGWPSHDASQAALRYALTNTTDQTECLRRLAKLETYGSEADALWVLTPETAHWLGRRFSLVGPRVLLWTGPQPIAYGSDSLVWRYHIQEPAKQ